MLTDSLKPWPTTGPAPEYHLTPIEGTSLWNSKETRIETPSAHHVLSVENLEAHNQAIAASLAVEHTTARCQDLQGGGHLEKMGLDPCIPYDMPSLPPESYEMVSEQRGPLAADYFPITSAWLGATLVSARSLPDPRQVVGSEQYEVGALDYFNLTTACHVAIPPLLPNSVHSNESATAVDLQVRIS